MCVWVSECVCDCEWVCVWLWVSVCLYVCVYVCVSVCVFIYVCEWVCVCVCVFIYVCVFVFICVCVCVCEWVCVCVFIYVGVWMSWCVCLCVCVYVRARMVGTNVYDGNSQKLMFGSAVWLLWSFNGWANTLPASLVTLLGMDSPFYSKWATIQWTHPSSVWATKCNVCQYAGKLWHLYSRLQKSSAFYSYFEFWDPKVNVNICCDMLCWLHYTVSRQRHDHLSWGMILEHMNEAPYSVQHKMLLQSCYWLLKGNPLYVYGADLAHWSIIFGPVKQHLWHHQFFSKKNSGA